MPEERATIDALTAEYAKLEVEYENADELPDEVDQRLSETETALATFDDHPVTYDPADIARAGVVVSIGAEGEPEVDRGCVRPEDEPAEAEPGQEVDGGDDATELNAGEPRTPAVPRAAITQQTHLFNTSIRKNLRIARPDATEMDLEKALDRAGIVLEVRAMAQGLDTMVGELGTQLSGGQARRIAIAIAFLKDAPILILDEPTEQLDAVAGRTVSHMLSWLMQGRTTLVISHRPRALRRCGAIIRIEDGRVMHGAT